MRWPDAINIHLWTYAIRAANDSETMHQTEIKMIAPQQDPVRQSVFQP
jgi:hypothetical protein